MATTIKRIYTLALAKIIEAPGTDVDFDSYSPTLLDSLLVEALPYENAIRAQRGDEELTSAPGDHDDRQHGARLGRPDHARGAAVGTCCGTAAQQWPTRKAESVMFRNEFVSALEDAAPAVPDYGEGVRHAA